MFRNWATLLQRKQTFSMPRQSSDQWMDPILRQLTSGTAFLVAGPLCPQQGVQEGRCSAQVREGRATHTHDVLSRRRTVLEVKRGCWASDLPGGDTGSRSMLWQFHALRRMLNKSCSTQYALGFGLLSVPCSLVSTC